MERSQEVVRFIEYDAGANRIIEPEKRYGKLRGRLFDVIKTYNPGVIVKIGVGKGKLLMDIARESKSYIAVVEPSMELIRKFLAEYGGEKETEKIHFINGPFNTLPVDYYAADLLIAVDIFDILESGFVMDEFRRALKFEGIFFLGAVVLNDDDIEGIYDDFMRLALPLHNDYYLVEDLKTFMDLKELTFIKGNYEVYPDDMADRLSYLESFFGKPEGEPMAFAGEHDEVFKNLYKFEEGRIEEPYYVGVFMRRKPEDLKA